MIPPSNTKYIQRKYIRLSNLIYLLPESRHHSAAQYFTNDSINQWFLLI
ncbi:MAG: hypothetical protein ACRCU9_07900 [Iodobacter sp.]